MAAKTFFKKLHQPVHPWVAALVLVSVSIIAIGVLVLETRQTIRLPNGIVQQSQLSSPATQQYQPQLPPTATPTIATPTMSPSPFPTPIPHPDFSIPPANG